MALTQTLGFDPFWYMSDLTGKPLSGGGFYAASSLNPTIPKAVYQDPAGQLAWPTETVGDQNNVILFNENGLQGPFYFQADSSNPTDLYYIQFYDANGNPIGSAINSYFPSGGSGGGSTDNFFIKNYVTNNLFLHNTANPVTGAITGLMSGGIICPSNHSGYRFPDVQFIKNNSSAIDAVSIINPNIAGSNFGYGLDPLTGDITPEYYLNFVTTGSGSGETQKIFQWPLDLHVKNMEQTSITVLIWAKGNSGTQTISPFIWQDTGSGGAPTVIAPVNVNGGPKTITTGSWKLYPFTYTIPSLVGKQIGTCGDDATYLQIGMPLNTAACNISFTKPKVYLGTQSGFPEIQTYDDVDSICMSPRTGDIRTSLNSFTPYGWVLMNDSTIGNSASGAAYANVDAWPLFNLIWSIFNSSAGLQALAPMRNGSTGIIQAYGASAVADFVANNRITLTQSIGRVMANTGSPNTNSVPVTGGSNTGTVWSIGQTTGNELHTQQAGELVGHTHTFNIDLTTSIGTSQSSIAVNQGQSAHTVLNSPVNTTGSGTAMNIQVPVVYMNMFIKL